MKAGIFGIVVPALMKKPTEDFMRSRQIPFSQQAVKKEFMAILDRQPEIGGRKNNLLMGVRAKAGATPGIKRKTPKNVFILSATNACISTCLPSTGSQSWGRPTACRSLRYNP